MALPPRLWLPDSQLESAAVARGLGRGPARASAAAGLWTPLPGGSLAVSPTGSVAPSSSTPRTLLPGSPDAPRVRRRALWRGEAGLPDRPVLVEWFPLSQLASERSAAARVRGVCHAQLLRLLSLGAADGRSGYAISEASDGVDLATVSRAAPGELPAWWAVYVIAQLSRAVQFLIDSQQRRRLPCVGHGRVSASTVFVGWNGSVQLLAFAASAGGQRGEETLAPELRASERLLSPAADVYALAVLLRQLLPASALSRPALGRLLRRTLHAQADQRLALPTFAASLHALLADLQAPLARAQAVGEVLGRFCPRASVDLLETDWGESTGDGLAALPPSLAPLSAGPVALSPTWYQRLAPPAAPAPSPSQTRRRLGLGAALLGGAIGLIALGALWPTATPQPVPPAPSLQPPQILIHTARPARSASPSPLPTPAHALPAASLYLDNPEAFAGLRLELGPVELPRGRGAAGPLAWVHINNRGPATQSIDLLQLRLRTADGQRLRPVTGQQPGAAAWVSVGAGRRLSRRLAFGPDVSDTAAASPPSQEPLTSPRPTPNASSSR